jgi:hypothetical protein
MKTAYLFVFSILLISSCSKDEDKTTYLNSLSSDKYFEEEVLTSGSDELYGLWKASSIYGWSGYSEPDFDYLEIKPFGIYGLIRNDSLFEYGKISQHTFSTYQYPEGYQIKLEPDYKVGLYYYFGGNRFFYIRNDSLSIGDGFIDGVGIILIRRR